jgi:ABC-type multidrug transport system fused ATPase/permease subunit
MKMKRLAKFLYIYTGTKQSLFLLFLMAILTSILESFGIGLIGPFLNLSSNPEKIREIPLLNWIYIQFNLQSNSQLVLILGLSIILIFAIKSVAYILTNAYLFRIGFNQKKKLVSRMMSAYLRTPYAFFLERNSATITQNIIIETSTFTTEYLIPLLTASVNTIIILFILSLLAKTSLLLLVMILGILLLTGAIFESFGKRIRKWGRIRTESDKAMIKVINHSMGGLKETRVIGCESYFEKQLNFHGEKWKKAVTLFRTSKITFPVIIQNGLIIVVVGFVCTLSITAMQESQDLSSILAVFVTASLRLIPSANQFINAASSIRNSSYSVDAIYADLKALEEVIGNTKSKNSHLTNLVSAVYPCNEETSILDFANRIELMNVRYRYPKAKNDVIKGISLTIQKGESIALIGKSGAGKTTLVDILLGLLEPQHGDIQVDGISIYKNLRSWQNLVGYIPQSIFLMDDTVERNIAFGVPDELIDSKRLEKAIQVAQLSELIQQLPEGVKTRVGERGVKFSGGQRQRIGIARAIYHEREVLVLDEATAALDNETEQLVSDAIQSLAGSKTLIIIAHRLSTVEDCDRVYLLEQGRIAKSGTYQEVVLDNVTRSNI